MRILVDGSVLEFPKTGIGGVVVGLFDAVARTSLNTSVLIGHRRPLSCDLPPTLASCPIRPAFHPAFWRHFSFPRAAVRIGADVVHFPWNDGPSRSYRNAKVITTVHDVIPLVLPELYFRRETDRDRFRRRLQLGLRHSDLVLTDSECSKRDILKHLAPYSEPIVLYPALQTSAIPSVPAGRVTPPGPFLLYVGGYERRKGLEQLVRVHATLMSQELISIPLCIVGQRANLNPEMTVLLDSARSRGAVWEMGYVTEADLFALYRTALGLIYPSAYEGFGYPPLEAMSQGCPVITTSAGSIPEICADAALYVKYGDDEGLARAIVELTTTPELRLRLGAAGRARAARFSWEQSSQEYLTLVDGLTNVRR